MNCKFFKALCLKKKKKKKRKPLMSKVIKCSSEKLENKLLGVLVGRVRVTLKQKLNQPSKGVSITTAVPPSFAAEKRSFQANEVT